MSASAAGPAAPALVCAFAVTRTPPDPAGLAAARGHEEGGALRVLRAGDLCLVVQDVPAALFGEEALTERLNRPEDLERCARAHHRGVEAAAGRGPVVPLPMATLYRGDRTAERAVAARRPVLDTLLDRLRDRTEWAVKVHAAEAGPGAPADTGGPAGPGSGGRAYLSRASARRRERQGAHGRALAEAEAVDAALRSHAVAATRHRPQSERLTGRRAPQLLNVAYLVEDARRADFTAALARFTAGRPHPGVRVEASGPWIPYSFARWDEDPRPGQDQEAPS
ncbi:GvpL/GvpF family gas vesicle protein [Streptomyces violaceoruber]|uniref:Gas vesicle synthesis protein n=8 Tax=Streptomyces TaxID=1883 RepID=Q9RJA8_STRCO|nr:MULTISPECIES: GvpL/GvpF family gas vesicle protein [Streptomyces]QSJ13426.1 gas vesicle synthesis protein [Streptomyces lividans]AIJ17813.1 gas vesicle synthesis protein [Streptomyces lividans TK24]KKD12035.1 gas vesicle protein [Streptomyces sp. WM6391]MDX2923015.1 GvpL/GvpF family gas vesicle protein [Streptomyces sp. NRRL_B-16638]MDX3344475.1 GvpL/GvpF family gas vesicle protein [Streptomyces sp. ME02-6979A]